MSAQLTVAAYDLARMFDSRAYSLFYASRPVAVFAPSMEKHGTCIEVDGDALANLRATLAVAS